MKWISVKDHPPEKGQIVVAWLSKKREPCCVRYEIDNDGYPIWIELVSVPIDYQREDIITHWMPLPKPPN
jgi:hypothetical protein